MKFAKYLSLAAVAALFASSAIAEPDKEKKPAKKPVDLEARFAKIDADSDGSVTLDELKAGMKKKPEMADKIMKAKDKDGNGSLSKEEFTTKPERKKKGDGKGKGKGKKKAE